MSNTSKRALPEHTIVERARMHSRPEGDCWIWLGALRNGTPYIGVPWGRADLLSRGGTIAVRQAILIERGVERPADSRTTSASCGTSLCVRPEHCEWESFEHYRLRMREKQAAAITVEQARESWKRHANGETAVSLAIEMGISRQGLYRQWELWIDHEARGGGA